MKNLVYPVWTASYIIFIFGGVVAKGDAVWMFAIAVFFLMPMTLMGYIKGIEAARKHRAVLIFLQLPLALTFHFRHEVPANWFGIMMIGYLVTSGIVAMRIRQKFPNDVRKF